MCPICNECCSNGNDSVKVCKRGAESINEASKRRKNTLVVTLGTRVHVKCRKEYTKRPGACASSEDTEKEIRTTRSSSDGFNFRLNCFLCGCTVTERERKTKLVCNVSCKNREVDKAITDAIKTRQNDLWATEVNGRLAFVNDLRAFDAIYHIQCNSNFRTGKSNPKKIVGKKLGRPKDCDKETAFIEVTEYITENADEQFTLNSLVKMMDAKVGGKFVY